MSITLVCPVCRNSLTGNSVALQCSQCLREYPLERGFPDMIVGGRFDDVESEELLAYEENCNEDTTLNYWVPTLRKLANAKTPSSSTRSSRPLEVLSIGCGTGVDVDILTREGFSAYGIDCGQRTSVWSRRTQSNRLVLANGKHLPFENESFDVAFCGCVFPHVGVVGDSRQTAADYREQRRNLAQEMSRVVRPGGRILVSSPNRWFPFDIFHGRASGSYRPQLNWPGNPFLLSRRDYETLFREAGCLRAELLPVKNYWGFIRAKYSWKGRILMFPIKLIFGLVSTGAFRFLRGSPINPWIVVSIEK